MDQFPVQQMIARQNQFAEAQRDQGLQGPSVNPRLFDQIGQALYEMETVASSIEARLGADNVHPIKSSAQGPATAASGPLTVLAEATFLASAAKALSDRFAHIFAHLNKL